MSRFCTLTFDLGSDDGEPVPDERIEKLGRYLKQIVASEGGRDVMFTKTADDEEGSRVGGGNRR